MENGMISDYRPRQFKVRVREQVLSLVVWINYVSPEAHLNNV
jgi:hypothetical protein